VKFKQRKLVVAASSGALLILAAFGVSSPTRAASAAPIKMAAMLSIQGPYGAVGVPEEMSLKLAVNQLNAKGGIDGHKIALTVYDDQGSPATATQLARQIVASHANVVIGPGITNLAAAVTPIFERAGILDINLVAQPQLWAGQKYIWSAVPSDSLMGNTMVNYAHQELHAKSIAIAYADVLYGQYGDSVITGSAKALHVTVATTQSWPDGGFNFAAEITSLKAAKPGAVLAWGSGAPSDDQFVAQLMAQGIKNVIGNTAYVGNEILSVVGKKADGFRAVSLINWGRPSPAAKRFIQSYEAAYKELPTSDGTFAYDAVYRYAAGVQKAHSISAASVAAAFSSGLRFISPDGIFKMTATNHVGGGVYKVLEIVNGHWN
jgi:branched-chain amino acid transport system substrate-binding protein